MKVDTVILATGQMVVFQWIDTTTQSQLFEKRRIVYDNVTLQTKVENVFISGDFATGPKTIVAAVKAGKDASISIVDT